MEGLISADEPMRRPAAAAGIPEHHRTRITRERARRWRVHFVRAFTINLNGSLKKLFPVQLLAVGIGAEPFDRI
jgi:hypothetical protein